MPEEDEERYFLRHPGGGRELAEWIVKLELAWTGSASGDHPVNTSIRTKWRPEIAWGVFFDMASVVRPRLADWIASQLGARP